MEARIQYIQKMESLGTMAGAVAHKFNNMLMIIMGYAEMMTEDAEPESLVKSRSNEILEVCEKAREMTNQIIAYTGHLPAAPVKLNLNQLILEIAPFLKISLPDGSVIHYNTDERIAPISAAAEQIRQVIVNLVMNAMEAVKKEKGVITVSTGVTELNQAFFSELYQSDDLPEGRYVFLEVEDNGCGMDEDTKRQIFDPFFTTKFFGRGLGLSAVLGIVKSHRGAIKILSKPGEGTTVRVLFPSRS
jgi:signal transduction histidine kinase